MLAVTMAKNEEDIIARTVANLFNQGVDRVVVADNLSTDNTSACAQRVGALVVKDDDPAYRQADKMTALAARFATEGEWVIPFDADEFWSGLDVLNDDESVCPVDVMTASPHVHYGSMRQPGCEPHPKVAFRWNPEARIDMGNHYVFGAGPRVVHGLLEVCHYQYRTLEQLKRKVTQGVAAYNLTDMPATYGAHWRELAAISDAELAERFKEYTRKATQRCPLSQL